MALSLWFDFMESLLCVPVICDSKGILRCGSLVDAVDAMLLDPLHALRHPIPNCRGCRLIAVHSCAFSAELPLTRRCLTRKSTHPPPTLPLLGQTIDNACLWHRGRKVVSFCLKLWPTLWYNLCSRTSYGNKPKPRPHPFLVSSSALPFLPQSLSFESSHSKNNLNQKPFLFFFFLNY